MTRFVCIICVAVMLFGFAGCASRGRRIDPDIEGVTTHDFNPKDLQLISKKSVKDLLAMNVLPEDKKPFVYVAKVRNLTDEHLSTEAISGYISVELSRSGKVRLSEVPKGREEAIKQLEFQQGSFVDPTTAKKIGKMVGADYFLQGDLSNISVKAGWKKGQYFLFTLTLVDIETLESWKSMVEVQKVSKRGLFGW